MKIINTQGNRQGWWLLCVICLVSWAGWAFLSKLLADHVGAIESQLLYTAGMVPAALVAFLGIKGSTLFANRRGIIYGLANGILTGVGTLCFFYALARGSASVVTSLIASFPIVTVLLAVTLLRERISNLQALGAVCAVLGLVMLS